LSQVLSSHTTCSFVLEKSWVRRLELALAAADTEVVNRPAPPVLTIRHDGSQRTFAAGHDVVIGRDLRADIHHAASSAFYAAFVCGKIRLRR
jgi:hypothetical protein